ncbi:MAG TPA: BON domain-containing protein [Bryobacteraceae bacterium]|jgi:hyperosmotically inducible protein
MKFINKSLIVAALTAVSSVVAMAQTPDTTALQKKVRHELAMMPYFTVFDNLSYRIDNGVVTLMGEVTRPVLKSDAEHRVAHIEGVRGVVNTIEVLPASPFDDRIRLAAFRGIYGYGPLQRYALGTNKSIRIIVKNGNISLVGVVDTQMDKNLANIRANMIPGVFSVSNDLQVSRS